MVKDQLIEYAKTGDYTTKELAELTGLPVYTVQYHLAKHGVKAKYRTINRVKFAKMASEGASVTELAKEFGTSNDYAGRLCKKLLGIKPRKGKVNLAKFKEAVGKKPIDEVAKDFGISLVYAKNLRRHIGVAIRKPYAGDWLLAAARTGKYSTVDLSRMFGITVEWAYMLCRRNGIEPRSCYEPPEPTKEPEPTLAEPGSAEKIEVLRRRFENGEKLWHPWDKGAVNA